MAEQARAKRDVETDLSQDDPLAELANIMGMTDEQQLGVSADEIELELERELLGDLAEDALPEQSADLELPEEEVLAGNEPGIDVADASFDDELTGELEDVLAGLDDGEAASDLVDGPQDDDLEADAAADDDPFVEIFSNSRQGEAELVQDEFPGDDELAAEGVPESARAFDERATDPYADEFRASLDEAENADADLHAELASLLGDEEESDSSVQDSVSEDDLVDDLRAIAGASETSTTDFTTEDDEFDSELEPEKQSLEADFVMDDDDISIEDEEALEAAAEDDDSSDVPDAEAVGWDNLDASDIRASEENEDAAAADIDEVDGELDTIFGDYDLSAEEDQVETESGMVSEDEQSESETEIFSGDSGDAGDLDKHFDERVAALFGHATPSTSDIEEEPARRDDFDDDLSAALDDMELDEEIVSENVTDDHWLADAELADEDMAPEPLAAMPEEEAPGEDFGAREENGKGDANIDALAALERAVSDLTGLGKGTNSDSMEAMGDVPDVETVSIEENVPQVQDGLGIPDLPEPEEPARPIVFDDIESEISAGFDGPKFEETAVPDEESGDDELLKEFDAIFDDELTIGGSDASSVDDDAGFNADLAGPAAAAAATAAAGATASYDRWSEDNARLAGSGDRKRSSRGLIMAALIGGVAVIGAIGAFMYFGGGAGGNGKPVVIAADNQPVKVKPADPGGKTVPNQDNKVYQRVSGEKADTAPKQKELVSKEEEPVDIAKRAADTAPAAVAPAAMAPADAGGGAVSEPANGNAAASATQTPEAAPKIASEMVKPAEKAGSDAVAGAKDEIQQAIEASKKSDERLLPGVEPVETPQAKPSEDVAVLAPRRVRTMIVKPDGTLVERPEDSQVAGAGSSQTGQNTAMVSPDSAKALEEAANNLGGDAKPNTVQAELMQKPQQADAASVANAYPVTPERAPIVPPRPAYQPVTVVGSTKEGDNAASAAPAPAQQSTQIASAAAPSGYTVQIASQPSRDAAEQTSANLARRYETVIGNRQIAIVPAEISGKGIYYRVRVVAQSLADANDLCSRYKAAGGECFVARP